MRKILLTFFAALLCAAGMWATPEVAINGKLPGAFSVSSTKVVYFSQGNLQYQASSSTWRFATNQYDCIGNAAGNTTAQTNRATQTAWIDLFGWGTSGAPLAGVYHDPYEIRYDTPSNYGVGGWSTGYAEWGRNAISNGGNTANAWRTLSFEEWRYLFINRSASTINGTANARFAKACVASVYGVILFPDNYVHPSGVTEPVGINEANSPSGWNNNQYTADQWSQIEAAGAVFLPAAGYRYSTNVHATSYDSNYYWSSSQYQSDQAYVLRFNSNSLVYIAYATRAYGCSVRLVSEVAPPTMQEIPLTFEAKEAGAQVTYSIASGDLPSIQYSTNGTTWTNYSSAITLTNIGDKVYFRGNNATYKNSSNYYAKFQCTKDCYIYGNIMSLVNATGYASVTALTASYTFFQMFLNNTHIKNHPTHDLVLPATTLTAYCYQSMFFGCTGLTRVPGLPATTLASSCYYQMFYGCSGLTSIPENLLPATTLANTCYAYMFRGCTGLTSIPENLLPATTLTNSCYNSMFYGCTGLTSIPENLLHATTLANYCYNSMFYGCTGLTSIPENLLPATTLWNSCYQGMFQGCSGLTSIPENLLPATTLANYCYQGMFQGCSGLTSIPENLLHATTLANYCYKYMFKGCNGLTTVPENLLPATTLADYCYWGLLESCTGLTSVPENLLHATTLTTECYRGLFYMCPALTSAPTLPATTLANGCYNEMFYGCTALTSAPALPATTLANYCYNGMFKGCTSLTTAPELPATTLKEGCYYNMFWGCTNLSSVTCYATATASEATYYWLYGVASSGTFYAPSNGYFNSRSRSVSAIPSGWNISLPLASITVAPTAVDDLVYSGSAQALINAGSSNGGTMHYKLGDGSWSTSIPSATNAGDYTVYYKVVGDAEHADYTPAENSVAVTITPAPLTITADNKEIVYNEAAPNYTATYDGFVGGEDASVLSGTLALTCDYSAGDALGDYTITPSGLTSDNYAITWETGTLSVVSPDAITLPDNEDKTALLTALNGSTLDITVGRTIVAGPYNTFCLPFSLSAEEIVASPLAGAILKDYNGADVTGTGAERDLNIYLTDLTDITAGKPFLIKTESNIVNPTFTSVTISYTAAMGSMVECEHVDFQGILAPYDLAAYSNSSPDYLGIGMDGRLYWADASLSTAPMRGFRAFFHVKDAGAANSPVRRGMHAQFVEYSPKTPTGVDQITNDQSPITNKIIRDGHLIIIRGDKEYNANGMKMK